MFSVFSVVNFVCAKRWAVSEDVSTALLEKEDGNMNQVFQALRFS